MYGLVLEGGGTRGSYHAGVYKALLENNIEIGAITGTSIGALNGAMFVQGDLKTCIELWQELDYSMIFEMEEGEIERLSNIGLDRQDLSYLLEKLVEFVKEGGLNIEPLKKTIDKYIDEDRIRSSQMDFGMVTFNISSMKPLELFLEDIPIGRLKDYILASAYLPVFKSQKLGGSLYMDGAVHDNLPFQMLEKRGYEKLILVRTHGVGLVKRWNFKKDRHIIISPKEDLGPTLDCSPERSLYNMELGYYDCLRMIKGLMGRDYYIEDNLGEDYFLSLFAGLSEEQLKELSLALNLEKLDSKRFVFEFILPRIALYLGLDKDHNYSELALLLMEYKARALGLERFRLYGADEFMSLIGSSRIKNPKLKTRGGILELIKEGMARLPILNRQDVLLELADIIFSD